MKPGPGETNADGSMRIVILGGGTAGWLAAGILVSEFRRRHKTGPRVTLVEPPDSAPIGVGEGSWPTMRNSLSAMGVDEAAFLKRCDASFKQGSRFIGWADGSDDYFHPFTLPQGFTAVEAAEIWEPGLGISYAEFASVQPALCLAHKAPKLIGAPAYEGPLNYGYHLDAAKVGPFLREHCTTRLGVEHRVAHVVHPEMDGSGFISALITRDGDRIAGDLFVDCTGINSLLIDGLFHSPWQSCADILFVDSALAHPTRYARTGMPIASATLATAQRAGWIWDIGLPSRRGIGHVYSSAHMSQDDAISALRDYVAGSGGAFDESSLRAIPIRSGYRTAPWMKNCVALGLAMGFVEPLEASSIMLTEVSAQLLARLLPADRGGMIYAAAQFNRRTVNRWDEVVHFLKLHYALSRRNEPFWRDNRQVSSFPARLEDWLETWRHRVPSSDDFFNASEVFPDESYRYVLLGMGHGPASRAPIWQTPLLEEGALNQCLAQIAAMRADALANFPDNRVALPV